MFSALLFSILFLVILLLPGFALSAYMHRHNILPNTFLLSLSLSYVLFVLLLLVFQKWQLSYSSFLYLQLAIAFASVGVITLLARQPARVQRAVLTHIVLTNKGPISIALLVFVYHCIVGPYSEVPADIYAHLGYWQRVMEYQNSGGFGASIGLTDFFQQKGFVWYHLIAFCAKVSGVSFEQVVYATTLLTKMLFMFAVYTFSSYIFAAHKHAKAIALLTSLLLALHMGINVMAYVRYYSFAPTMLNFVLYFAAIATFLQFLQAKEIRQALALIAVLGFLTLAAAAIHTQEALFILIMVALIALCDVLRKVGCRPFISGSQEKGEALLHSDANLGLSHSAPGRFNYLLRYSSAMVLACAALGFIVLYSYAQLKLERAPNVGWRLWEFGQPVDWLPQISVLNLKYQFIRTITLWGVLVYLCAVIAWRDIRGNLFLVAGLLSPLFTLLNPFFVDLFLRVESSTTLWRMAYIIPVHFVAALLIVKAVTRYITRWRAGECSILQRLVLPGVLALSVLLLLPIKNTYQGLHYSRFPTLAPVAADNSYEHLQDALDALNDIKAKKTVLTDPVTGYVVSALTHHHSYRHKFFPRSYIPFSFSDYSENPLRQHQGKLLLINRRSHALSKVGALAKHWPETVLRLERYYPDVLLAHLQSQPEQFQLLWFSADEDLLLYEIRAVQN